MSLIVRPRAAPQISYSLLQGNWPLRFTRTGAVYEGFALSELLGFFAIIS